MSIDPPPRNGRAPRQPMTLSTSSSLSLALVLGVISGVAGGSVWATRIEMRLERIEGAVNAGTADRWTSKDMRQWVEMFDDAVQLWSHQMDTAKPGEPVPRFLVPDPREVLE